VTDASIPGAASSALVLGLEQNQPNPFRPETEITFTIPSLGEVDLTVYNIAGRTVRRLTTGARPAGRHSVKWDGRDAAGQRVAAGVYFYRLVAADRVLTRKMTVMK
jgi:flagellar hook assembly protein FlgD